MPIVSRGRSTSATTMTRLVVKVGCVGVRCVGVVTATKPSHTLYMSVCKSALWAPGVTDSKTVCVDVSLLGRNLISSVNMCWFFLELEASYCKCFNVFILKIN